MPHHNRPIRLLATLILGLALASAASAAPITPRTLPTIIMQDYTGAKVGLAEYRGRPILLHLWATWCAPCLRELPSLHRLKTDYDARDLAVVTLSEDFSADKVRAFFRKRRIDNLPVLIDPNSATFQSLGTRGLPISILIDRSGNEVRRFAGNTNWDDPAIRARIDALVR